MFASADIIDVDNYFIIIIIIIIIHEWPKFCYLLFN